MVPASSHCCYLSVPQESSDLDTSFKCLYALEGGVGKNFDPCRRGSLVTWITVLSSKPAFTAVGFYFKSQTKIIQFSHIEEIFQVSL